jgi:hypothetical protein
VNIMEKKPSPHAETLARQLQEKLRVERPRWYRWAPILTVVLLGTLALFAWLLYPAPDPPRLTITATDALYADGEELAVRALLEPQEPDAAHGSYAGLEVVFWEEKASDPASRRKAICDGHGQATATLDSADPKGAPFHARYIGRQKYEVSDRAWLYVLPKDAPLLVVEVEETLAELDPEHWSKTNPIGIAVRAGAAAALRSAADKGYRVVYLAVQPAHAKEYRPVRGWVESKSMGADPLPRGPVLSRPRFASDPAAAKTAANEARAQALEALRGKFTGAIVAVVRTAAAAQQCQKLDIRPLATGGGDFPDGVTRLKSWADLPAALGK